MMVPTTHHGANKQKFRSCKFVLLKPEKGSSLVTVRAECKFFSFSTEFTDVSTIPGKNGMFIYHKTITNKQGHPSG